MHVKDIMSVSIVTIPESASCHDAVEQMVRYKVRHLPVVSRDGRLRGIVTDRDLRHHLFAPATFTGMGPGTVDRVFRTTAVDKIMSSPVVTVSADRPLNDAATLMLQRKIGALPVLEEGRVVGMLTETDLLRHALGADVCCREVESIVVSYP